MPSPSAIPMAVDARWSRYYPAVTAAAKLADPWAPYCPVPIYVTMSVLALDTDRFSAAGKASELAAAYGWSKNRVVYYFDPTLAAELCAQADDLSDTDVLPAELLTHLPYPCVYIASNGSIAGEEGFFAWVEDDTQAHRTELRALLYTGTGTVPLILHLLPGATIGECVQDTLSESLKNCAPRSWMMYCAKRPKRPRPRCSVPSSSCCISYLRMPIYNPRRASRARKSQRARPKSATLPRLP